MSGFKISEVASKMKKSVEEVESLIKEKGVDVSSDGTLTEDGVKNLGVDPKHLKLDKRQEMLKKAMERHKKHPRAREVKIRDGEKEDSPKKLSKEELLNRKRALEKSLQKVDEQRETVKDTVQETAENAEITPEVKPQTEEKPSAVENNQPAEETKQEKKEEKTAEKASEKQAEKPVKKEKSDDAPRKENKDRPQKQGQRRDQKDNRRDPRAPRKSSGPYRDGRAAKAEVRSTGPYKDGRAKKQEESTPQDRRDNRRGDDRPPRRDGRPNDQRGGRPDNRGGRPGDNRGGGGRPDYRSGGGRPVGAGGPPKPDMGGALDDKKKRVITKDKDKEKQADNKDPKKAKAKGGKTKEKSFHKVIDEGFEELTLEQQIEQGIIEPDYVEPVEEEVEETKAPVVETKTQPKGRDNRRRSKKGRREEPKEKVIVRPSSVQIGENIIVSELAKLMGIKATEIIKQLMGLGVMAAVNQAIDAETAQLVGSEYGIEVQVKTLTEDDILPEIEEKEEDFVSRPPIVTVMGHVDHGKTSLLDAIRSTSVADREAGGITQHIGAYEVMLDSGKITFLDTPGHEAFTTLRARGAQVTDICILLVAADDGVMPQTKEAIDHVKAAGVRMVVAINKIDKPNANIDMVRSQLAEYDVISEEWGGDYQFQEISAKSRIGIEDLLERILLEAELLELKGNPDRLAEGIVIESKLDKQKGAVATILINKGTLRKGDNFVVGSEYGKVRAMFNYKGKSIKEAGLSVPVELMGFSGVPQSGERFISVPDEKTARQLAEMRADKQKEAEIMEKSKVSLADLFAQIKEGDLKELNIVLKADVQGSLEALKSSLVKLSNPEVKINIIHAGVGGITESDVILAEASNALIFGFNVRPDANANAKSDKLGIEINLYSIIYQIIDDVKQAMEGMLDTEKSEQVVGKIEIRQVFSVPKIGKIGGCYVTDGKVNRNCKLRVIRDNIVIYDGNIGSLKRFQDDVKEVAAGYECGVGVDKYNDIKEGDILEAYEIVETKRTLEDVEKDAAKKEEAE